MSILCFTPTIRHSKYRCLFKIRNPFRHIYITSVAHVKDQVRIPEIFCVSHLKQKEKTQLLLSNGQSVSIVFWLEFALIHDAENSVASYNQIWSTMLRWNLSTFPSSICLGFITTMLVIHSHFYSVFSFMPIELFQLDSTWMNKKGYVVAFPLLKE